MNSDKTKTSQLKKILHTRVQISKLNPMTVEYLGNKAILEAHKTAFLCSRQVSSRAVLRCYDWATEMRDRGEVVVSGFQSKIEKDVLHFLLKGKQPVIMVIARQMYKTLPQELQAPLEEGRLLIISTAPTATRVGKTAAEQRNTYIAEIADSIVFGYIHPESSLKEIYKQHYNKSIIICPD